MASADLVGPVPSVRFHDGTKVAYATPTSTMDPRWKACTEHRVACDCREAEFAEEIGEVRSELRAVEQAMRDILAGHPTYAWEDGPNGDREVGCMCTGCQIVRRTHVLASYECGPSARDRTDGLSPDEVDAGLRWATCHSGLTSKHAGICASAHTRDRGHYHEHLMRGDVPVVPTSLEDPF